MRISLVQMQITHLDPEANFQKIESFLKQAKAEQADVVVFPEDCITTSIFGDLTQLDRNKTYRDRFCELAKHYKLDVVSGSCMEGTTEGSFNTSYYIDHTGTVLHEYHKNHLYGSENRFLTPGSECRVFETRFGRAAIVICWDLLFPALFQTLKQQGVEIIYCPSYWYEEISVSLQATYPHAQAELINAVCLTRAVETNAAIVYVNAAGTMNYPNGSIDTLIGQSQITLPVLGRVAHLTDEQESMLTSPLDLTPLSTTQNIFHSLDVSA